MPVTSVFVYGLLQPGESLHHVVRPFVVHAERATARGRVYRERYLAARFDEPGTVAGWVLHLDASTAPDAIARMDEAEDEGTMYRRVEIDVCTADGRTARAWAYEWLLGLDGAAPVS